MSNTLGLDDDLDPVEVLAGLEEAFALKISDGEAVSCLTVGDVYDLLTTRFAEQLNNGGACITSMTFYRLRRALRRTHPDADFRPSTSLVSFAAPNARLFFNQLRKDAGLIMPGPRGRWMTAFGGCMCLGALIALVVAVIVQTPLGAVASVAALAVGIALARLDPGILPEECVTLGGLTRKASALNYGALAQAGGSVRADGLWEALTEVLSEWSDLPKSDIRRETFLLQSQLGGACP